MTGARSLCALAAGTIILGFGLSGCSALQIHTAEKDAAPVRVAVQDQPGSEPTAEPTKGGVPEGMTVETINLGAACPVEIGFALGGDWTAGSSSEQFHVYSRGTSVTESDMIIISCNEAYDDSAQAVVDGKKNYAFSEKDSQVQAERMGTITAGTFWSYQGVLGPTEILSINQRPTAMYGTQLGYKVNGRLVNISIEMRALETNTKATEEFKQMLPTLEVEGERVPTPQFK
ncbi:MULTISPECIES: hypothetical protein [unclassified Brevibacterium]|uniref:hypothetical protein n=1 Tax=unclassified Brevibacterium TaxID=2614124 RepID=UPI001E61F97D|nr:MULTISPECIES: hypothetical protein [unclassified Brevibacterium]MDK8433998.1 hypothetical protein [Brevibacterium sp. H-BE7]